MFCVKHDVMDVIKIPQYVALGALSGAHKADLRPRRFALIGAGVFAISLMLAACANVQPLADLPEPVVELKAQSTPGGGQLLPIEAHLFVGDRTEPILLEIARTPEQQALGLMNRDRDTLPDNQGMVFPFNTPRPAQFWMKNVRFSLDMLFVRRGKVQAIEANVPPCIIEPCAVYGPNVPVDGVIELVGGQAEALNIQPGDTVTIEFLEDPSQSRQ